MKVLFIGLIYNPQKEKEYILHSRVGIAIASNLYQWNTIKGIIENGVEVEVVGSIPYGSYPELSDVKFVGDEEYVVDGIKLTQIGFVNLYGIKHKIREQKIKNFITKWASVNKHEKCVVMFYDLLPPFLNTIIWAKNIGNVKTCLIVPDLAGKLRNDCGVRGVKVL